MNGLGENRGYKVSWEIQNSWKGSSRRKRGSMKLAFARYRTKVAIKQWLKKWIQKIWVLNKAEIAVNILVLKYRWCWITLRCVQTKAGTEETS